MATTLTAKPSAAAYRYTWEVPVVSGDSVLSAALVATGCTVDSYEIDGNSVNFFVSGGTAGATASIVATVGTVDGETIVETFYIPIRDSAVEAGNTVRDVLTFALRPITGVSDTPDADMTAVALETFNDMVDEWRIDGLDIGIPGRSDENTVLSVRDEFLSALKYNLRVRVAIEYGYQLSEITMITALNGRKLVENVLFNPAELSFENALLPRTGLLDV